jgi:hypothetical protein
VVLLFFIGFLVEVFVIFFIIIIVTRLVILPTGGAEAETPSSCPLE